ncbi:unnamed protein product [Aphis gossypii]|uniref:Uncharacterized protein n=1 Tax=Aphis gossypii TaxID=80765 RepID=A0A9P0IPG1_APHGO|nr:unnamed protein product [Aphis gossypii]
MLFGREVKDFESCINLEGTEIKKTLTTVYANNNMGVANRALQINKLLGSEQKTKLTSCLNKFEESVKTIHFDELKESDFVISNSNIGNRADDLMKIITNIQSLGTYYEDEFSLNQYFYRGNNIWC